MDPQQNPFDREVERLLGLMSELDPTTDDYKKAVEALKTLCEARSKKPAFPIDLEMLIQSFTSILGIVLILNHERINVVTSRAIGFVKK